jgi:mono/diheme cytochrome c family protein
MRAGTEIPLSGGRVFDLGLAGKILAPNLTSDAETGIGALSDDTLVRSVRYGISRQGRPLAPFMSFANLADADLIAILSYLRTLPPVRHAVPANTLSWAGSFALHFVIDPQVPSTAPQARMPAARTAEYGRYLAYTVANCNGCHTKRSTLTGAFVGRPFAGGMHFEEAGGTFIAPDLRPVPNGVLDCTEQEFIARFRVPGRAQSGSPMPWNAFERMADADLGAIYAYLRSLPRG